MYESLQFDRSWYEGESSPLRQADASNNVQDQLRLQALLKAAAADACACEKQAAPDPSRLYCVTCGCRVELILSYPYVSAAL